MRVQLLALGLVIGGAVVAAACGGETDTTFGPPNGLVGRTAPTANPTSSSGSGSSSGSSSGGGSGSSSGSSSGGGSGSSSGSGSGGGDAGGSSGAGDSGATGTCSVSWKTGVFPLLISTGPGTCGSTNCHGGTSPPTILDGDSATTYTNLTKYTINGKALLIPGNTDPAGSSFECNMGMVTPACGIQQMPLPPGALAAANRTTIDTWVRCGAPNN